MATEAELRARRRELRQLEALARRREDTRGRLLQTGEQANLTLSQVLGMPVDAVNSVLGLVGLDSAEPILGSRSFRKLFSAIGAGSQEATDPIARGIGITLGSLPLGVAGRAATGASGISALRPTLPSFLGGNTANISSGAGRALAGEIVPSIGAAGGIAAANQIAPGSVGAEIVGGMGGSLASGLGRQALAAPMKFIGRSGEPRRIFASRLDAIRQSLGSDAPIAPSTVAQTPRSGIGNAAHRLAQAERTIAGSPGGRNPFLRATETVFNRIRNTLLSKLERGRSEAQRALDARGINESGLNIAQTGRSIRNGLFADDSGFIARFQERSSQLFDAINDRIGQFETQPRATLQFLTPKPIQGAPAISRLRSDLPAAVRPSVEAFLDDAFFGPQATGRINYEALHALRQEVGAAMTDGHLIGNRASGLLKSLYKALSRDMEDIADAAGELTHFRRLNDRYTAGLNRIDDVIEGINKKASPEAVYRAVVSGRVEDATALGRLRSSIGPERFSLLANQVMRRMGIPTKAQATDIVLDSAFSPVEWARNFTQTMLRTEGRAMKILLQGRLPQYERYANLVNDIMEVKSPLGTPGSAGTSVLGPAVLFGGASGAATGFITTGATGGAIAAGLAGMGLAIAATNGASRLLTSPRFMNWLATATTLKVGSMPGHIARLQAIAAQEPAETQDAILDFLDTLRATASGTEEQ